MTSEPNLADERKNFLLEAIKDGQAIIRALDFKANALLVVMTLLLANANRVAAAVGFLARRHDCLGNAAVIGAMLSIITGVIAAWFAVLTLAARFDPRSAIDAGSAKDKPFLGAFFAGGYFAFQSGPSLIGRFKPRNPASLEKYIECLPYDAADVVTALAYEQLKIAFIRDSKGLTIRTAYAFGVATLALVSANWLCGIILGSDIP